MALPIEDVESKPTPKRLQEKPHRVIIPFRKKPPLSPDEFRQANGVKQEKALLAAIERGDIALVGLYRPDMKPNEPLSLDERRMAVWTHNITQRGEEIKVPKLDIEDGLFAQIHHRVFDFRGDNFTNRFEESKQDLARKLETERQRGQQFFPAHFAPSEDIGGFLAARRYLGLLTELVRLRNETPKEREKRVRQGEPVLVFQASNGRPSQRPTTIRIA